MSQGYSFRASFLDPEHILSSYCSLSHFGGLLTSLSAIEPRTALLSIRDLRESCQSDTPKNLALQLAIFLSSVAVSLCRYLIFLSSPLLFAYSNRLGHLIGGSMAKEGFGIIPVTGDVPRFTEEMEKSAAFMFLTVESERDDEIDQKMRYFRALGVPYIWIQAPSLAALMPETFKWEIATVLACAGLGKNPFAWPDVRQPRKLAMDILERLSTDADALERTHRLAEQGIQLFAEGRTRSEISNLNLLESLRSFFRLNAQDGAIVIFVFLERSPGVESALRDFRQILTRRLRVPVLVYYGPRCFDQYAYLCETELPPALYVVLTSDYMVDAPVPGASYSFSQLHTALALGEFESMLHTGQSAIRLNFVGELSEPLANFKHLLEKALPRAD